MFKRFIATFVCFTFIFSNIQYLHAQDFSVNQLPVPGTMVGLSAPFTPVLMKGLKIHPENPFLLDFIMDAGRNNPGSQELKSQSEMMVKYFLAALTVPEKDMWVNLSPYEKDRILPYSFSRTELGRDLLGEDYILKQLTASALYPEKELGRAFWSRVYRLAKEKYGTTAIPVSTFNKVWIVADKVSIYEKNQSVYIVDSRLKVMLEEDYLAKMKVVHQVPKSSEITNQILRELVLPEIEKEVNTGKNFALLRQAYNAVILATWFKRALKDAVLNEVYANKNKVAGIDLASPQAKEEIYQRYLRAYKKGAFNYIKEDIDALTNQPVPRKYFSGGMQPVPREMDDVGQLQARQAMAREKNTFDVQVGLDRPNRAMLSTDESKGILNEQELLFSDREPSNTGNAFEVTHLEYFNMSDSLQSFINGAILLSNLTPKGLKRLTSNNPLAAEGLEIDTLKIRLREQRETLNDAVESGALGGNSFPLSNVEFKVISEETPLPYGYVFDFVKHVVYIKPSYLKKFNESNGYYFQFFARAILEMSARPIKLPVPIFSDNDTDEIKQEKMELREGQQILLTEAARRELEVKYVEAVVLKDHKLKQAYDNLFKSGCRPEDVRRGMEKDVMFRTLPTTLAEINFIKRTFINAPPESVRFTPPSEATIEMNNEIYRLGVAVANIMAVNAMNDISEYANRGVEETSVQRTEEGKIVHGVELKLVSTSSNPRKTKIFFAVSKWNPVTWAQFVTTVLLPFALSGADVLIVSPSEFSNVKREIQNTIEDRKAILTAEMRGGLGNLPYILSGNTFLSKDKELKLPFKHANNMRYWNGEEVLYMLCQQFGDALGSAIYAAGGDYNYLAQPKGSVSTFDPTGQIDPQNLNPDMLDYYLFWYLSSPDLYKHFLSLQNNGIPGSKYNRPFDIGPKTSIKGAVTRLESLPPQQLEAVNQQKRNRKVFEALLLDPVKKAWYSDLNLLHEHFNSQDFPVMPRFLVPAKIAEIQEKFPHTKIIFALTMRLGTNIGDDIIPSMVRDGVNGHTFYKMNIPGLLSQVSATALRENGMKELLDNHVNSDGLGTMPRPVGEWFANNPEGIVRILSLDGGFSRASPINLDPIVMEKNLVRVFKENHYSVSIILGKKNTRINFKSGFLEFNVQHKYTSDGRLLNVVVFQTWDISLKRERESIKNILRKYLSEMNTAKGVITEFDNEQLFLDEPMKDWAMTANVIKSVPAIKQSVRNRLAKTNVVMPGGIDLNADNAMWQTRKENGGVSLRMDTDLIAQIRRQGVPGFSPVVISITPVQNLAEIFGLN